MTDRLRAYRTLRYMDADTVLCLRQDIFEDHLVSEAEAESLIALGKDVPAGDATWTQFYCEALTDWVMRQEQPEAYVSEGMADRLLTMLGDRGSASALDLDLLAHICYQARAVPGRLTSHALLMVRDAVLADGRIDRRETQALRQFLYAPGGEGRIGITRAEAELVFDINDVARDAGNDPEWPTLFVQAISAYVMSHTGYAAPDRDEALRLDRFMETPGGIAWLAAARRPGEGLRAAWHGLIGADASNALRRDIDAERAALAEKSAVLTDAEVAWLVRRLTTDGQLCQTERLLVSRLRELVAERGERLPFALAALVS